MDTNVARGLFTGASVVQGMSQYLPEPVSQGIRFAASLASGDSGSNVVGISAEYQALIEKQIETQMELQQVTFTSNIERSKHESRMAAIRNVRAA